MSCPQCEGIELTFDEESVRKDQLFYQEDGPEKTTLWLTEALKEKGVGGLTLLDIGGGLGAIQHELLDAGVTHAMHVDGSSAYIEGAKEEAKRRELHEKIDWLHGDFVELANELKDADIVTLDRVICCYDNMDKLVNRSVRAAKQYYGVVYPRDRWISKLGMRIINFFQGFSDNPFRAFVHPVKQIEGIIQKSGFKKVFERNSWFWHVQVYARH